MTERVLDQHEQPWQIMKQVGRESIYRMQLMRFYLQLKQDPHGTAVALFVGNLPKNFSERNYETFLTEILGKGEKKYPSNNVFFLWNDAVEWRSRFTETLVIVPTPAPFILWCN